MKFKYQSKIFAIIPFDIPICCQIWFHSWANIRRSENISIPEYGEKMHIMTNNTGVILCPECLIKKLKEKKTGKIKYG